MKPLQATAWIYFNRLISEVGEEKAKRLREENRKEYDRRVIEMAVELEFRDYRPPRRISATQVFKETRGQ